MIRPASFFAALLLTLVACRSDPAPLAATSESGCRVARVIDGDTVDLACQGASPFRARLTGYDTPETYEPSCASEAALGLEATARLRALVTSATSVTARISGTDRYGRRLVALSLDGRSVSGTLIAEGLAAPYSGGRRPDWCARLG